MGLEKQYAIHEQFPAEPLPEEPPGQRPPSKPSRYERVVVRRPWSQDVIERLRGIVRSIFARKYRRQIETPQPLVSEPSQGQGSRELGPMKTERLNRRTRGERRLANKEGVEFDTGVGNTGRGRVELDEFGDALPLERMHPVPRPHAEVLSERQLSKKRISWKRKEERKLKGK